MVPTTHLLAFTLTCLVIIAVPGPSVLFTVSRALTVGRRGALLTVVGNAAGVYLQVAAVAGGVGVLVERSVEVFTIIKLVGAAYLVFLGVQAIRHRHALTEVLSARIPPAHTGRMLRDGFIVGMANPKSVVFFVAALPQFVDPGMGHIPLQLLILGAFFPAIALVSDSVWAFVAGTARAWFAGSPKRMAMIGGTGGLAMIGIGAHLALTGRKD